MLQAQLLHFQALPFTQVTDLVLKLLLQLDVVLTALKRHLLLQHLLCLDLFELSQLFLEFVTHQLVLGLLITQLNLVPSLSFRHFFLELLDFLVLFFREMLELLLQLVLLLQLAQRITLPGRK